MKKHIPNLLTCANLFCGCLGINAAYQSGDLVFAAYMIGLSGLFDFFDGFAARLLKVSSPIGKELDSLADMVSFGLSPSVIMYLMLQEALRNAGFDERIAYIAFLIAVFSALRLAKFNIDTRQTTSFIGVPTPANAILIGSLPLIVAFHPDMEGWIVCPYLLSSTTIIMSLLLVAELPLFSLKFKSYALGDNKIRYSFLALAVILIVDFKFTGVPLVIVAYILFSVLENFTTKKSVSDV